MCAMQSVHDLWIVPLCNRVKSEGCFYRHVETPCSRRCFTMGELIMQIVKLPSKEVKPEEINFQAHLACIMSTIVTSEVTCHNSTYSDMWRYVNNM